MALDSQNRNKIRFYINGVQHSAEGNDALLPLAQYLRYSIRLSGTKVVCAEGDCGACTVLVSRLNNGKWSEPQSINSCIAPVYLFDSCSLVTVEGLQDAEQLSEVQFQMRQHHGGQCGYCTPGMVCSLASLAEDCQREGKVITEKKARNYLTGNLCRCTGYEPILKAATSIDLENWNSLQKRYCTPEAANDLASTVQDDIQISQDERTVFAPCDLQQAIAFKNDHPQARIVAGATDLGVLHNKGKSFLDQVLVLNRIRSLSEIKETKEGVWVGALISLTALENFITQSHSEFARLLRIFASPQIKNQGTLIGNVMNGSPIGDSIPALLALNAVVKLQSTSGSREIPLTSFYKGYKSFDLKKEEIATGILIPKLEGAWASKLFKVSVRKDLDISAVTFAGLFKMEGRRIAEARLAMGGVGPTVVRLSELEKEMSGQDFTAALFENSGKKVHQYITPISDLRASDQYRQIVASNLFRKCYQELQEELSCP